MQDSAGEVNARHSAAERQSPEHPHAQPDSHIHRMNAQSPEQTAMDRVPAVAGHGGTPIVVSGGVAAITPSAEGSISLGDGNAAVITSAAPLVTCSAVSVSLEAEALPMEVDAHVEAVARGGAMSSVMAASGVDVPCHVLPAPEFQVQCDSELRVLSVSPTPPFPLFTGPHFPRPHISHSSPSFSPPRTQNQAIRLG